MRLLQSVQNAVARLINGTLRCDHISPVLRQLHWLPVRQRVSYKIVTLFHRCLSGHVPSCLADDCRLNDVGVRRCVLPTLEHWSSVAQSCFGDRTFAAAAPRLWNSLPSDIRQPDLSCGQFRRLLKTFLLGYSLVGPRRSATCVNCALKNTLTHLLTRVAERPAIAHSALIMCNNAKHITAFKSNFVDFTT